MTGGAIPRGTTVSSKTELVIVLACWLGTGEKTIGNVGTFGGKPWIRMTLPTTEVVLDADTKRAAVQAFLDHAADHGPDSPWHVVANTRGTRNKVTFTPDGSPTPGWYAYTTNPRPAGTTL